MGISWCFCPGPDFWSDDYRLLSSPLFGKQMICQIFHFNFLKFLDSSNGITPLPDFFLATFLSCSLSSSSVMAWLVGRTECVMRQIKSMHLCCRFIIDGSLKKRKVKFNLEWKHRKLWQDPTVSTTRLTVSELESEFIERILFRRAIKTAYF